MPDLSEDQLDKLHQELILDEGLYLNVYVDTVGKRTIGVGRNIDDNPLTDEENDHIGNKDIESDGITKDDAMYLLDNDINKVISQLKSKLDFFDDLDPIRQRVLIDLGFNMGVPGLLTFKNTLNFVRNGDYDSAAAGLTHSKWFNQVGVRGPRLVKMMKTGQDCITN